MLMVRKDWKTLAQGIALVVMVSSALVAAGQGTKATTANQDLGSANISRGIQIVRSEVHHDVSLPLRDLIVAKQHEIQPSQTGELEEAEPLRLIPLAQGLKPEGEPGCNAEVAAAAPEGPEELGVAVLADLEDRAISSHELH